MQKIWMKWMAVSACTLMAAQAMAVDLKGDVRLRTEAFQQEDVVPSSYWQQRLMFRLGSTLPVNPSSDVEFRLSSGTGRTTTNQTLGKFGNGSTASGFLNMPISLDRAYFRWHGAEGANVYGGRVRNYFFLPGGSDLVWDSDLNFDGMGFSYEQSAGPVTPFVNLGFFWVSKNQAARDNVLGSAQVGIKGKTDAIEWAAGGATYRYSSFAGQSTLDASGSGAPDPKGNSIFSGGTSASPTGTYKYDYRLWSAGADVATQLGSYPVGVAVDFVTNSAAPDEKTGYLAGARIGSLKKAGEWMFAYDYRQLQRDAVVGAFTESDSFGAGGTDGRGHRFKAGYVIDNGFTIATQYFVGKKFISDGATSMKRDRFQLDVIFAF